MDQKLFEREVFDSFVTVAPFKVVSGSVENRDPPEPDIVCEIEEYGRVGFELTELIDQNFMARLNLMFNTKKHLSKYWKTELSDDDSDSFKNKYANALIHVVYVEGLSLRKRKSVSRSLFDALNELPDGEEGTKLKGDKKLSHRIREVRIRRGNLVGPIVDVDSFGWLGDPTYDALSKKFAKNYNCDYPIELVAHIETDLLPPDGAWIMAADKAVAQLGDSPFTRLWVFDRTDGTIKYEKRKEGTF